MVVNYSLIGKRVAARRNHFQWTQAELAERAKLTEKYISKIETSRSIPSIQSVMQLCVVLELSPNYLLFGVADDTEEENYAETAQKLKLCNTEQLRLISGFIDVMLTT